MTRMDRTLIIFTAVCLGITATLMYGEWNAEQKAPTVTPSVEQSFTIAPPPFGEAEEQEKEGSDD